MRAVARTRSRAAERADGSALRDSHCEYEELKGIEWEWLSCDGAMGKALLGGAATGPNPTDRAKKGVI